MPTQPNQPVFGPYSPIRQADDLYFISGQVGIDPHTKAAPASVEDQTRQILANLGRILATEALVPADVVKTTVYLTDMGNFAAMNAVYIDYFETPRPARACIAVKELPRLGGNIPLLVEIEAIANRRSQ